MRSSAKAGSGWSRAAPEGLLRLLAVLAAAVALCWPALINGQPFFHPDTQAYVHGPGEAVARLFGRQVGADWSWKGEAAPAVEGVGPGAPAEDAEVLAGRSIYYGVLAWLGDLTGGFWLTVLVQGLAVALLADAVLRGLGARGLAAYGASVAVLALATPAPLFVSLLMPDVWAGVAIAAVAALFALNGRLSRLDTLLLGLMLSFAALAHNSIVLVLAGTLAAGGLLWLVRRRGPRPGLALSLGGVAVAAGVGGTLLFGAVVERTAGKPPLLPPFVTARLQADAAGARYVRERCDPAEFVVCRYAERLPLDVDDFLWAGDPATGVFWPASAEERRALSAEQARFAVAVTTAYPLQQVADTTANAARQLVTTELKDFNYHDGVKQLLRVGLPASVFAELTRTPAWRQEWPVQALWAWYTLVLGLCLIAAAALALARPPRSPDHRTHERALVLLGLVTTGMVVNAVVCGGLSALHGRYEARVEWCLPLAVIALALVRLKAPRWQGRRGMAFAGGRA
jgi:hypothetical protein